ncbi:complement component 4 binding protein, alpha, isoform CRA_a [Rattus norvegicus]|uniref:C4b-binding protein alpha chain n=1 Tax=Rattus norvegicus TaxID=10116 RepID=A6IBY8_RAT|nr:complement component 4 binding protein, alpha, isoform CRA_a [Rattus norvegicus]
MWTKQHQALRPTRAAHGKLHRNRDAVAWPLSTFCRASGPTLFQMSLTAALWVAVFGKCGPPPDLPYALPASEMNQTDFESHTTLRYNCRPGYSRASSSQSLYCKPLGKWQINIACVKKSCRNPGDLQNGKVEVKTDFLFGSQIEFSCSEGYILIGSSTSYCEIQGKGVSWSDPLPECVIAKCGMPPDISNGKHNGREEEFFTYRSSVTYKCDPDFTLLGNASITCTVVNKTVGVWSPSPPTCERIICPWPKVLHGTINSGFKHTYKYKDSVRFVCQKGFVLRGSGVIHCEADGSWSPVPVCELNSCTDIPDIPNAALITSPRPRKEDVYPVGTVLRYICRPGYEPATRQPMTVICQKDLSWSMLRGCKEICCPVPDPKSVRVIQHEKAHPDNDCTYFFGDEVSYTCQNDIMLTATCKSDGTWHPWAPSCHQSCDFPPAIAHGRYTKSSSYYVRTQVTYECEEGYRLVGEATISCWYSQWTPAAPQCKALCRKPEIGNGVLSTNKDQYVETENVTIQCDSGFVMLGSQSITCSENGTWYPKVPRCEQEVPKDCEHVFAGKKLMQCLPNSNDVKMALEVYKLTLEIKQLQLQIDKAKHVDREL